MRAKATPRWATILSAHCCSAWGSESATVAERSMAAPSADNCARAALLLGVRALRDVLFELRSPLFCNRVKVFVRRLQQLASEEPKVLASERRPGRARVQPDRR